jgi:hypothetical protein
MQRKQPRVVARTAVSVLAAAAAVLSATGVVSAQARELFVVSNYDVPVGAAPAFASALQAITAAAREGDIQGVSWHGYRDGGRFALVFPIANMAELDDVDRFNKAFRGTAGQAAWTENGAKMSAMPYSLQSEVLERVPSLSYRPAQLGEENGIRISRTMVIAGAGQDYEAVLRDANAIRARVNYPYRVDVYRTVVGEARRYLAVTFYDSREAFNGANSLGRLLSANPEAQAAWTPLIDRNRAAVASNRYEDMNAAPGMTYVPGRQ